MPSQCGDEFNAASLTFSRHQNPEPRPSSCFRSEQSTSRHGHRRPAVKPSLPSPPKRVLLPRPIMLLAFPSLHCHTTSRIPKSNHHRAVLSRSVENSISLEKTCGRVVAQRGGVNRPCWTTRLKPAASPSGIDRQNSLKSLSIGIAEAAACLAGAGWLLPLFRPFAPAGARGGFTDRR